MENADLVQENFDVLLDEISVLRHLRDDVARRGESRMHKWVHNVKAKEYEVAQLRKELEELNTSGCPNSSIPRLEFNKKVIECLAFVADLNKEGNYNVVAHRVGVFPIPNGSSSDSDHGSPETIETFINQIASERPLRFSHRELKSFTSDFSSRVGFGAYGEVYKGLFPNGVQVAVKVLKDELRDYIEEQFMAEVSTMGRTYHRNLVRLYGFCFDVNMKALVYEYMENGSFDKILYENHLSLEWKKLYDIATETARGLSYLHENCHKRIIHYDIKAGNVLIDKNLCPKIGDFGLAKLCSSDLSHVTLTGGRGTPGYAAPEIWRFPPQVTYKCDIYSYGMMLFEVLGRRRNLNRRLGEGQNWFPLQVWEKFEKGQLEVLMTSCGIEEKDRDNARRLCMVALWCAQLVPQARPSMSNVVKILEGEMQAMVPPNPFPHMVSSGVTSTVISGGPIPLQLSSLKVPPPIAERHVELQSPIQVPIVEAKETEGNKKTNPEEKTEECILQKEDPQRVMAMNVFGIPVTDDIVRGYPNYADKDVITRTDRASVAVLKKYHNKKLEKALRYVQQRKERFGIGAAVLGMVYNATGDTVTSVNCHDWNGHIESSSYAPQYIANGQWGAFLSLTYVGPGSEGAVIYRGKNEAGDSMDWILSWSVPWARWRSNKAYGMVRKADHFMWGAERETLYHLLRNSSKEHGANWNGCVSNVSVGSGISPQFHGSMTLTNLSEYDS